MEKTLEQVKQLRKKTYDYDDEVAESIGVQSNEIPVNVFPMIFNKLTLGLELLNYYLEIWRKIIRPKSSSLEEAKKENRERVITIQRMIFIEVMSSIEFCFKEYVKKYPEKIDNITGRIYLSKIINKSNERDIVINSESTLWEGIIELRNALVHNNGISDETAEYVYPNCKLILCENKMIQGDLKLFLNLIDWLLDSVKSWIFEMNKR